MESSKLSTKKYCKVYVESMWSPYGVHRDSSELNIIKYHKVPVESSKLSSIKYHKVPVESSKLSSIKYHKVSCGLETPVNSAS